MKVLVTGGSRGIGKAIVDLFIANGHSVYSPTRNELDLAQPINLEHREFDIIINCVGINPIKTLDYIDDNDVMLVNYLSPLEIIQQCLPHMVDQQYGRIINIGSIWIDTAKPGRLAYWDILTNTVSPGFIETELTYQNNTPEDLLKMIQNIPASRLGKPEEVARLVYQLTVENTFISGQNIIIDGGFSCTTY